MTTRKRASLSAAQKRELCEKKEKNPNLSNIKLALQYYVRKSTITDILKEKRHWLSISESQENFMVQSGLNLKMYLIFGLIMHLIQNKI